ncbi:hypothetical protein LP419_40935 [Massilia sp. H-1]|nr:hypothetical protein LP419_40935 [Massilia sp. H-1]
MLRRAGGTGCDGGGRRSGLAWCGARLPRPASAGAPGCRAKQRRLRTPSREWTAREASLKCLGLGLVEWAELLRPCRF